MHINQQKEQFSNAYVRAVAATAGFSLYKPEVDDDSVDFGIAQTGGQGTIRSPKLEFQLKCTANTSEGLTINSQHISYRLKIKNYDDLRVDAYLVPRILVVVFVPDDDEGSWLTESESHLILNSAAYWVSLRGLPTATVTGDKVAVHLPRTQMFSVDQVTKLMSSIGNGIKP